jgi:hypothetical protein
VYLLGIVLGHNIVIQETDRERQTKCDKNVTRAAFKPHLKTLKESNMSKGWHLKNLQVSVSVKYLTWQGYKCRAILKGYGGTCVLLLLYTPSDFSV